MEFRVKRQKNRNLSPSTLHQSNVAKNATDKFHKRIIIKIRDKKDNSPKLFKLGLIAILAIFGFLIIGLVALQNQGATEANVYKSKTKEYLEAVYNASTISSENPYDISKKIDAITAPKLGFMPLGIFSYQYVSAQLLASSIASQVEGLTAVVKTNGEFYDFYNKYIASIDEIASLNYGRGSERLSSLLIAKAKYQDLSDYLAKATLPNQLQTSQNNMKDDLTAVGESIDGLIAALKSGNNSAYALSSYKYSSASDKLSANFATMSEYNGQIKQRLKLASQHFEDFRKSLE